MKRFASLCAAMGICSWALALGVLTIVWGGGSVWTLLHIDWSSSLPVVVGLWVVGAAQLAACALIRLFGALGLASSRDDLGAVRRALLHLMLGHPRFGISAQTPMDDIGLSVRYMPAGGIRCRNKCAPFSPGDFRGVSASDFGGVDFMCADGDLLVFTTVNAKKAYIKAMSRKRRSRR